MKYWFTIRLREECYVVQDHSIAGKNVQVTWGKL